MVGASVSGSESDTASGGSDHSPVLCAAVEGFSAIHLKELK